MTLEEAYKIAHIWGTYLEYSHAKLSYFFGLCSIPKSFLPFSKDILEEALNMAAEDQYNTGNVTAVTDMQKSIALLTWYIDDKEAMLKVVEQLNDKKMCDAMLARFKSYQDEWSASQKL